jgi:hypothetical protein
MAAKVTAGTDTVGQVECAVGPILKCSAVAAQGGADKLTGVLQKKNLRIKQDALLSGLLPAAVKATQHCPKG